MNASPLSLWVAEQGGPAKAALILGITDSAVRHYLSGRRRPRPEVARLIERKSAGRVSAAALVLGHDAAA